MKTLIAAFVAASFALPAMAEDVKPAPERDSAGVYQVIRATDNQLSCPQLISEMNQLNAKIKQQAAKASPQAPTAGGQAARGAAIGAVGGLAQGALARMPFGGGLGSLAGRMAASSAISGAQQGAMNTPQQAAAPAGPAVVSDEQQRLNRITPIFASKGC